MEDIQLILSIASIVAGTIIGVAGLWWANRIAKKSRVFDKAELDVLANNHSLILNNKIKEIIFGFSIDEKNIILCAIDFVIANTGELSAKNVNVRFVIPVVLRRGGFSEDISKIARLTGIYDKKELKRKSHIKKGFEYVDYLIPEITPGKGALLQELFDISHASGLTTDVEIKDKKGIPKFFQTSLEWSSIIETEISATDINPSKGSFVVRAYKANTINELKNRVIKEKTNLFREELKKIGAPENFISQVYAPIPRDGIMLIMPKLEKIPASENMKNKVYIENTEISEKLILTQSDLSF